MNLRWTWLVILAALAVTVHAGENVITNGSFETPDPADASKPQDWALTGTGAYVAGGHAGKCITVKGGWSLYNQKIVLKPNTSYKISCWVKGTVPGDLAQIVFGKVHDANKEWKSWDIYIRVTGEWKEFVTVITTPENCPAEADISLLSEGAKGDLYFDDISMEQM